MIGDRQGRGRHRKHLDGRQAQDDERGRHVALRLRDQRVRPVEHRGHAPALREQVLGMEVPVTDHARPAGRPVVEQPAQAGPEPGEPGRPDASIERGEMALVADHARGRSRRRPPGPRRRARAATAPRRGRAGAPARRPASRSRRGGGRRAAVGRRLAPSRGSRRPGARGRRRRRARAGPGSPAPPARSGSRAPGARVTGRGPDSSRAGSAGPTTGRAPRSGGTRRCGCRSRR